MATPAAASKRPRRRGALVRFGIAQALLDVQFWLPLWLVFLLERGFTLGQAALADAVFRVGVVVLELPMGWVCDRLGRHRAYPALCLLTAATFGAMAWVDTLPSLLAVWLLWALQWATASGLGGALGYDLAAGLPATERRRTFARFRAASAVGVLASLASAGLLYQIDPMAPFLVTASLALIAAGLTWRLPTPAAMDRQGLGEILRDPRTRWLLALAAGLLVLGWPVQILYQPLALQLGLSASATSAMYVAMAAAALVGAIVAGRVHSLSPRWQLAAGVVIIVACGLLWWRPELGPWLLLPLLSLAYALATTITEYQVAEQAGPRHRAAGMSLVSLIGGLFIAVARPGLLVAAEQHGTPAAFGWWALVGCLPLLVMLLAGARLRGLPPAQDDVIPPSG